MQLKTLLKLVVFYCFGLFTWKQLNVCGYLISEVKCS